MAVTLDNTHEDLKFYDELKRHAFGDDIDPALESHNRWMVSHGLLQIDALLEFAIGNAGGIERRTTHGMDYADGSDAKKVTSNWRKNNRSRGMWTNSYIVRNIRAKRGMLRIMGYNRILDIFQYYAIPYWAYSDLKGDTLDIILDQYSGYHYTEPTPRGGSSNCKWNAFKKASFMEMAAAK